MRARVGVCVCVIICVVHRNSFAASVPQATALVAVEMGGSPLQDFRHPKHATYILGSEDSGLPEAVTRACDYHVALPSVRAASYNVAVAGSLVMYDRLSKERRVSVD